MSNISTLHSVVSYTSGKTKPLEGQRLAKVTYKVDKATGVKPPSMAVSIPVTSWEQVEPYMAALKGEFLGMIHSVQDKIVRTKIESGAKSISDEDIAMSAVVSYLQSESGRLTGDDIRAWFTESLKEPLMLAFASKLGIPEDSAPTSDQETKLNAILKGYEDSFAKLASGAASFNQSQSDNMIKAMEFVDSEDYLRIRFTERLTKKSDTDLLMSL
jgi:hypothetical protein